MERGLFSENDKHIIAFNSPRIHAIIIGTESIFHNDHFNVFVCEMRSVGFLDAISDDEMKKTSWIC